MILTSRESLATSRSECALGQTRRAHDHTYRVDGASLFTVWLEFTTGCCLKLIASQCVEVLKHYVAYDTAAGDVLKFFLVTALVVHEKEKSSKEIQWDTYGDEFDASRCPMEDEMDPGYAEGLRKL